MHRIYSILLLLSVSCVTMGQKSTQYMVHGHVADLITRAPIDSAWVILMDSGFTVIDSVQAVRKGMYHKDGGYMFRGSFPKGEYFLKYTHPDYHSLTIPLKLKSDDLLPVAYLKKSPPHLGEGAV